MRTLTTSNENIEGGNLCIVDQLGHKCSSQHAGGTCEKNISSIESLFNDGPLGHHAAGV